MIRTVNVNKYILLLQEKYQKKLNYILLILTTGKFNEKKRRFQGKGCSCYHKR